MYTLPMIQLIIITSIPQRTRNNRHQSLSDVDMNDGNSNGTTGLELNGKDTKTTVRQSNEELLLYSIYFVIKGHYTLRGSIFTRYIAARLYLYP